MPSTLGPRELAVLRSTAIGHLATLMPDGAPQVSPVWVDADDHGLIVVNTADGRLKLRNVRRDPRVALSIEELDEPREALMVRGVVVEVTQDGAFEHMDTVARRYDGKPWTPVEGQQRVIVRIRPERVSWF